MENTTLDSDADPDADPENKAFQAGRGCITRHPALQEERREARQRGTLGIGVGIGIGVDKILDRIIRETD